MDKGSRKHETPRDRAFAVCRVAVIISLVFLPSGCGPTAVKDDPAQRVARLVANLESADPGTREAAAIELGTLSDERAVKPLISSLGDDSPPVRLAAAKALRRIGHIRGFEPVYSLARKSTGKMRQALLRDLGRWGAKDTEADRGVLRKLSKKAARLEFDDIELKDVMQFIRDVTGVPISVDWRALGEVAIGKTSRINIHLANVRCDEILWEIVFALDASGAAAWTVTSGRVSVSSTAQIKKLLADGYEVRRSATLDTCEQRTD